MNARDRHPEYMRSELQREFELRKAAQLQLSVERSARNLYAAVAVAGWTAVILMALGV